MKSSLSPADFKALIELFPPINQFELWTDNYLNWQREAREAQVITTNDIFPSFQILHNFSRAFIKPTA